jgi:class 3 adenylate cyclase
VPERPETGYASSPLGRVAYQRAGDGPVDVLGVKTAGIPVDLMGDEPRLGAFLGRLGRFSRHIWFDQRGSGASDRPGRNAGRFIEDVVDDMVAVLDHLGCERVAILGTLGPPELLFAATHPTRTRALVLINPFARVRPADGYEGLCDAEVDAIGGAFRSGWGSAGRLSSHVPSVADDPAFRRWYSRCQRLACSPDDAYWRFRASAEVDLREVLPAVKVPTLVVSRTGAWTARLSRYVAAHIEGARLIELPGDDVMFFVGDTTSVLDPIEEFLTGRLPTSQTDRVLATVVFTDLVGSTAAAASLGDRRWRDVLVLHDGLIRHELERHRGREVKAMGDGFLALFDGPGRAVRFGCAVRDAVSALGVAVRVGVHTGEVVVDNDDVAGLAVHIAQRVEAHAEPGEVLVSRTVVDLVAGSDLCFADRGEHHLRGVPQPRRLFAVEPSTDG